MEFYGRPMLVIALITLFCSIVSFSCSNIAIWLSIIFVFLFIISIIFKFNYRISFVFIAVVIFLSSLILTNYKADRLKSINGKTITADFLAISDTEYDEESNTVDVVCLSGESIPYRSKFQLEYIGGYDIECGQSFTANVYFSQFDDDKYKQSAFSNNVFIKATLIYVETFGEKNTFYDLLGKTRTIVYDTIDKHVPLNTAAFLKALVCGNNASIDFRINDAIRNCGASHMFVVSGLHLAILMGAINAILNVFIHRISIKRVISIIFVLATVCICGFTVSVIRAAIMFIIFNLAPIFKRQNDSLNSLGFAVYLISLVSPYAVFGLSFQYTVTATLGIVWVVPFYTNLVNRVIRTKIVNKLINILATTVIATAFTLPITISNFGFVSVVSPIANIILNFPMTYSLALTVLGVILDSGFILRMAQLFADFSLYIINILGNSKFATVKAQYSSIILSFCFIALLAVVMLLFKQKFRKDSEKDGDNK